MLEAGWHTRVKLKVPGLVHLLFLPPTRPNANPPNTSGSSPTRRSSTSTSPALRRWRTLRRHAASPFKGSTPSSAQPRVVPDGLSASGNDNNSRGWV